MRPPKLPPEEEARIIERFEDLRKILLSDRCTTHRQRPLAYWAKPNERRLPLALLGRRLDELLRAPFAELSGTPGIGRKKIHSLMMLLGRAAETDPAELADEGTPTRHPGAASKEIDNGQADDPQQPGSTAPPRVETRFDPNAVSEVVWSRWQRQVIDHGLEEEMLGRFAPSLQDVNRVMRHVPLGRYTGCTLAEMRAMKAHGEKRVRVILEIFHDINEVVGRMGEQRHLTARVVPRRIDRVERWTAQVRQTPGLPGAGELHARFVQPLLEQVRDDAPRQIVALAEKRLGLGGAISSIRQAAQRFGLTRARIYQLLNEISDILAVRWPTGRDQVYELRAKLQSEVAQVSPPSDWTEFLAAVELFYPGSRRGAEGTTAAAAADDDNVSPA